MIKSNFDFTCTEHLILSGETQNWILNLHDLSILKLKNYQLIFDLQAKSKLQLTILGFGELKLDLNLICNLTGEHSELNIEGALFLTKASKVRINASQNHLIKQATSDLKIHTVLANQAQFDYRGLILIGLNSSDTVAHQINKNIILSPDILVTSIPTIEVLNPHVYCGHGSAIGELDAAQLNYLMSRGLSKLVATNLLLTSFLKINNLDLQNLIHDQIVSL